MPTRPHPYHTSSALPLLDKVWNALSRHKADVLRHDQGGPTCHCYRRGDYERHNTAPGCMQTCISMRRESQIQWFGSRVQSSRMSRLGMVALLDPFNETHEYAARPADTNSIDCTRLTKTASPHWRDWLLARRVVTRGIVTVVAKADPPF